MLKRFFALSVFLVLSTIVLAQDEFIIGDPLPTAPDLAKRGSYHVGVHTITVTNPGQVDLLNLSATHPAATYDRALTVEIWFPAILPQDAVELTEYEDTLGQSDIANSLHPFTFTGRALRDAAPDTREAPYPLVILSHGYPGSRLMMLYLTENLASKGYVVASIGHTESTFSDVANFGSTLLNRTLDQRFVIDALAEQNEADDFLSGMVDVNNTALIGYSMGGYGALNTIGAGYNQVLGSFLGEVATPLLADSASYLGPDARIKAAVLFAPWGGDLTLAGAPGVSLWDAEAMSQITTPTLWIVGSEDDVSIYASVLKLFEQSTRSERYMLVYDNALHNVAPNPPPPDALTLSDYERYAEPVWDERQINNVNQHFVTAFLEHYLRGEDYSSYLNPAESNGSDAVDSRGADGTPTEAHTYWAGFAPRTLLGLQWFVGKPE